MPGEETLLSQSCRPQSAVLQELDYKSSSVLGLAQTWPQAAGVLPSAEDWFDWQGDQPLHTPMDQLTIYEMHVRGFTQHASSGSSAPGEGRGHAAAPGARILLLYQGACQGHHAAQMRNSNAPGET